MSGKISIASYLKYWTVSLISAMAGSQFIHNIYLPLDDLEDYVEKEIEILKADKRVKT